MLKVDVIVTCDKGTVRRPFHGIKDDVADGAVVVECEVLSDSDIVQVFFHQFTGTIAEDGFVRLIFTAESFDFRLNFRETALCL